MAWAKPELRAEVLSLAKKMESNHVANSLNPRAN
jgi:hypothetical protein